MPRKRSGTFERWPTPWPSGAPRFRFRLRLADGTKTKHYDVEEGLDEKEARALVVLMQAQEDARGGLLEQKRAGQREAAREHGVPCEGETADAWHERFLTSREGKVGNVKDSRGRWRKWVSKTPVRGGTTTFGELPMAAVARDDIEAVRDGLDDAIAAFREHGRANKRDERRLMPKAAQNVWTVVTTAFKQACAAKRATALRVREDNPCANVQPPEQGSSRRKTWIYPNEFLQLVSCEAVPLEWRELYAVACYLYLRPGELFELRRKDVDMDLETVSVSRAWDWEERAVKAPKTRNGVREVPVPAALVPLLARLCEGKGPEDNMLPIMARSGENKGAGMLREHLELAGVTHPRLTEDSATRMRVGFRSWRDTGITWSAIDGVDVHKLQRRAGHDDINTTLGYVKEAEDREKLHGKVFPALPNELVWPSVWPNEKASAGKSRGPVVPEEGVEPPT
ncbi:MAG: tyrosine-type recombinase/integrase [Labilithrix sp.]|nr:tyrosine-type recombinase/integrase [Labilithrix sp.]